MRVQPSIEVKVETTYLDIEGLRIKAQYGSDREAEMSRLYAQSRLADDGSLIAVYLTGAGKYVNKNGAVGQADARIRFGSLSLLPPEWQERITADLQALADRVTVAP